MTDPVTHEPQSVLGPEKIEWRGIDSKVFEKLGQPGEYQLIGYEQPVHYLDTEGKLQDIDLTIVDGKVDKCCYIAEIMKDNIGIKMHYRDTGQKFEIILKDIDGIKILGRKPDEIQGGCVAVWKEVAKDLDIAMEFQMDQVRIFRKLNTKDAPVKIHFETITQELIAKDQVHVNQKFFGQDAKGREVILETKFDEPVIESKKDDFSIVRQQIHDTFTKQIVNIDEKTRVRTKGDDVEYPVIIDPIIGSKPLKADGVPITSSANYDEIGWALTWNAIGTLNRAPNLRQPPVGKAHAGFRQLTTGGLPRTNNSGINWEGGSTRFPNITIPQGAIINSAVLTFWRTRIDMTTTGVTGVGLEVKAMNTQIPFPTWNAPTFPDSQFTATIFSKQFNKTNFVKSTGGSTLKATLAIPNTGGTAQTGYNAIQQDFDVQAIVQRLVDQFGYVNQPMYFDLGVKIPLISAPTSKWFKIDMYSIAKYNANPGTPGTSYGNGPHVTRLVIDFTVAAVTTTSLVDAMLLYQGSVWGQCGAEPW